MKKILYFVAALAATSFITTMGTSCKFAPDQHDGDTVAASEFYQIDTSAAHAKKMAKIAAIKNGKDSVGTVSYTHLTNRLNGSARRTFQLAQLHRLHIGIIAKEFAIKLIYIQLFLVRCV